MLIRSNKKGLSTVFGVLLFLILISAIASSLYVTLYRYNDNIQEEIIIEDDRSHEKIMMTSIELSPQGYITGVNINNSGSITTQIRAFYVNNVFICDPSNPILNPNGAYIKAQDSQLIKINPVLFNSASYITMATSRGMKAIELESHLVNGTLFTSNPMKTYYGPLRLNFSLFFYQNTSSTGIPQSSWQPASNMTSSNIYVAWNITVTNIDTRDITLSQYSTFTLVTNDGGSQYPWYIKRPGMLIPSNATMSIIYSWNTPYPTITSGSFTGFHSYFIPSKVFLTFFGKFSDGIVYAQTIPFEGIVVRP